MVNVQMPKKAFILAAGFGTRLRPYTDHCPKPMVEIAGKSLILRTLDKLHEAGIHEVVVNLHYMANILETHLKDYAAQQLDMTIQFSFEDKILDTGGGVKNALHFFGNEPFYVIAGDALWSDGEGIPVLERLARHWNSEKMDILTLMQPLNRMDLTSGVGDYDLLDNGLVQRSHDKQGRYMWTNIRLNAPHIYRKHDGHNFSFLEIMDNCEEKGRFYALEHDGDWHHISTPEDLEAVDQYFRDKEKNRAAKSRL